MKPVPMTPHLLAPAVAHIVALFLLGAVPAMAASLELSLDVATGGPGEFAAEEIRREAAAKGMALGGDAKATRISITVETDARAAGQSYSIHVKNEGGRRTITVRGADAVGAMYGGLDIAEAIRTGTLDSLKDSDHTPHIKQRGIKFNLPLDVRTPTYNKGEWPDSERLNVAGNVEHGFLARDLRRHGPPSLQPHLVVELNPFPSIVKVPEFPNVALEDVQTTGVNKEEIIVVKKMTIDEKIQFLREVMQMAKDRGVDVYWFTWNVFLGAAEGKDGITENRTAPRTIEYYRASVRETIKTYPLLAGFGITAGEGMPEKEFKEDLQGAMALANLRRRHSGWLEGHPRPQVPAHSSLPHDRLERDSNRVCRTSVSARPQLQVCDRPHVFRAQPEHDQAGAALAQSQTPQLAYDPQ